MGFNGDGADKVLENLSIANSYPMTLGINFGNKITPNNKALDDYLSLFDKFKGQGSYYVINVSSPNTRARFWDKVFSELSQELLKKKLKNLFI